MNDLTTFILAMGPPPTDAASGQGPSIFSTLIPMALMVIMFYFVLIRPQTKAKKEHEKLLAALKSGDRVTMSSGILGTVTNIKDKEVVVVKIADNVKIEVLKSSITAISKEETKDETK